MVGSRKLTPRYFSVLSRFPMEGEGKRALGCNVYDKCLYEAAILDWASFNCERCRYEAKGPMETIDQITSPKFETDLTEWDPDYWLAG